jgi:hypothetical protein
VRQLIRILVASAIVAGIPAYGATEINHWLWDANQAPSYQACADSRDNVPTDIYIGGLVKVWGRGAKQYGGGKIKIHDLNPVQRNELTTSTRRNSAHPFCNS